MTDLLCAREVIYIRFQQCSCGAGLGLCHCFAEKFRKEIGRGSSRNILCKTVCFLGPLLLLLSQEVDGTAMCLEKVKELIYWVNLREIQNKDGAIRGSWFLPASSHLQRPMYRSKLKNHGHFAQ